MKISVCVTTLNEEETIASLLDSLFSQSAKPEEIIIVDAGSKDKTVEIISHYQKKFGLIKLLKEKCSRAKGRNMAVDIAKNEIIAMTDAGCVPNKDWLASLTLPFSTDRVGVAAGFYTMKGETPISQAMSIFLGTSDKNFDVSFLPSTRSIAFRKSVWAEVGGFPESIPGAAEDTVFNYKLLKNGVKISRVKNAIVEWGMPGSILEFRNKIFDYAKGDAKSKIWIYPNKSVTSHNIHSLSILLRYIAAAVLFVYCLIVNTSLFAYLLIGLFAYFFWSFRKIYIQKGKVNIAIWGPVLQIVSDFAVIGGFISGMFIK